MTKVVFLDVDGVLNNRTSMFLSSRKILVPRTEYASIYTVDRSCALLFRQILLDTGAKFVVSSSWGEAKALVLLHWAGFLNCKDYCLGETTKSGDIRGHQIQMWLDSHPEVTSYIILDDDSDMLDTQLPRFIKTNHEIGLTVQHYLKALRLLGKNNA